MCYVIHLCPYHGGDVIESIYKQFGIYRITNKVNGNTYIGKTATSFGDRWECHRSQLRGGYHDNSHLQRAWNKYGENNFEFSIVEVVNDKSLLNDLEINYISVFRANNKSYNIHDGGDGGFLLGKHLSDLTKKKIGEKNRINMLGRKTSEETKQKMSESQRKKFARMSDDEREEYGRRVSKYASGYRWSDAAKQNFSEMQKTSPNGAKYNVETVREIRRLHEKENMGYTDISKKLGIPRPSVYLIATYRRWKYI